MDARKALGLILQSRGEGAVAYQTQLHPPLFQKRARGLDQHPQTLQGHETADEAGFQDAGFGRGLTEEPGRVDGIFRQIDRAV